MPVSDNYLL